MKPRLVEIYYGEEPGFYTKIPNPRALSICKDSRDTVINSYPICFKHFYHPIGIRFNFELDTLFLGDAMWNSVAHIFGTFGPAEIHGLRYLAVNSNYAGPENAYVLQLRNATSRLPALREVVLVYDISDMMGMDMICDEDIDELPTVFLDEIPEDVRRYAVDLAPLPDATGDDPEGFKLWDVPSIRATYGWVQCSHGLLYHAREDPRFSEPTSDLGSYVNEEDEEEDQDGMSDGYLASDYEDMDDHVFFQTFAGGHFNADGNPI